MAVYVIPILVVVLGLLFAGDYLVWVFLAGVGVLVLVFTLDRLVQHNLESGPPSFVMRRNYRKGRVLLSSQRVGSMLVEDYGPAPTPTVK